MACYGTWTEQEICDALKEIEAKLVSMRGVPSGGVVGRTVIRNLDNAYARLEDERNKWLDRWVMLKNGGTLPRNTRPY